MTASVAILDATDYATEIDRGAQDLAAGKLVVLSTDTVYGVAGILTDPAVRAALRTLRTGPADKPFTPHLARPEAALDYLGPVSKIGRRLMHKVWPGPVGLVFDVPAERRKEVSEQLDIPESDLYHDGAITLRCPDERVFFDVVSRVKDPIAVCAPAGGGAQRVADLPASILQRADRILDAGPTRFARPSTLLRVGEEGYQVVREGVFDQRIIDRLLRTTVLFICSGNTCRSPMAEAIARQALGEQLHATPAELEKQGISVVSAGTFASSGARATPQGVEALEAMGLDISRHRSRPLTVELIRQADVIYAMTKNHARTVVDMVPSAAEKVFPLDPDQDIEDPIGGDLDQYVQVAKLLKNRIEKNFSQRPII